MAKTIDELKSAAAVVRDATEEKENTALRIGQLFLDTIETLGNVSVNGIKGYEVISSTDDLPANPTTEQQQKGYLMGTILYVYVATGGDTLDGKYQSVEMKGPKGNPGTPLGETEIVDDLDSVDPEKVLSANQGRVLKGMINSKTIDVVDDLTTGGRDVALSAEQGKELKGMIDNVSVKHGTFADALDAVLASNSVFEWMLVDEVDSDVLIKPLWHVNGSLVDAAGAVVSLATLTDPVLSIDSGDVYVGTTVTITCPSGSTLYYSVNGIAATSTSDVKITINEASVVKAYLKSGDAVSDIVAKSYGIAVDHKFQFKIKLTEDNSTEYVPVVASGSPRYTMTVDWGDGSTPSEYTNKYFISKGCGHTYSGTAGDEFVITLRGTAIPYLQFNESALTNILALVAILENTLVCKTHFSAPDNTKINMGGCSSLNYLSADAFSNSNNNGLCLARCSSLTSLEDGFFTNLISGGTIETCHEMFMNTPVSITASQMSELKSRLSQCAVFSSMFYGTNNYIEIPNDFFVDVEVEITSVYAFTHTSGTKVTGDAKALYDALQSKVSSAVSTKFAFTGRGLSNRNQVPSAWGGTGS